MNRSRSLRVFAAVVLLPLGGCCYSIPIVGPLLLGLGLGVLWIQVSALWRERPGKYDLGALKLVHDREMNRDEPEEDDSIDRDMIYCHRCGGSLPGNHSICPECGSILGKGGC